MFYYLGIIKDRDARAGNYIPSYILCKRNRKSEARSGWMVVKTNNVYADLPKVLVTDVSGNEAMIDFLSRYRTRDHMIGSKFKSTEKYYPEGVLCWFECDIYGQGTGNVLYIKHVPEKYGRADDGYKKLRAEIQREKSFKELLLENKRTVPHDYSDYILNRKIKERIAYGRGKQESNTGRNDRRTGSGLHLEEAVEDRCERHGGQEDDPGDSVDLSQLGEGPERDL